MEFLHIDVWTVDGVAPNIVVISSGTEVQNPIPNGDGTWQSIDIPVAGITGDLTRAIQFKFEGGNGSSTEIYVENLYFWKGMSVGVDNSESVEFNVVPNPSGDYWNIKGSHTIDAMQVFDMQGQLVMSTTPDTSTASINASDLASGVYIAKLSTAQGVKSVKLIKK
jgi:hypothetical protein